MTPQHLLAAGKAFSAARRTLFGDKFQNVKCVHFLIDDLLSLKLLGFFGPGGLNVKTMKTIRNIGVSGWNDRLLVVKVRNFYDGSSRTLDAPSNQDAFVGSQHCIQCPLH